MVTGNSRLRLMSLLPSPDKPAVARLPAAFLPSLSPLYLDTLTRATLPCSSLSSSLDRHPYLSKPIPARLSPEALLSSLNAPSQSIKTRSLSIGSLKKVVENYGVDANVDTGRRRASDGSATDDLASWMSHNWWPFATEETDPSEPTRSLLDLFVGKGAVDAVRSTPKSSPGASPILPSSSSSFSNPFTFAVSNDYPNSKPVYHHRRYSSAARKPVDKSYLDEEDTVAAEIEEANDLESFELIKERYRCPRHPIVFAHGLFGFDTIGPAALKPLQISYWVGVKEALEAIGVEVLIGSVPMSGSIEERAKVLCEQISKAFPNREINLIGHSMGGLDCRFLITHLKPTTFKVRSLTTIATPHRGSSFADFMLEDVVGTHRVPALLSLLDAVGIPGGGKAFDDLTTTNMAKFNDETPDDPSVKYYSYAASFVPSWSNSYFFSHKIILEREGPNDGVVSVASSKWGEFKGELENVNHLDLVGWVGKIRFTYASWSGRPIRFSPISFYCGMSESLADEGF